MATFGRTNVSLHALTLRLGRTELLLADSQESLLLAGILAQLFERLLEAARLGLNLSHALLEVTHVLAITHERLLQLILLSLERAEL